METAGRRQGLTKLGVQQRSVEKKNSIDWQTSGTIQFRERLTKREKEEDNEDGERKKARTHYRV